MKTYNDFIIYYPILEKSKNSVLKKIEEKNGDKGFGFEIRVDYLLGAGLTLNDSIDIINTVNKKHPNNELILTIRTKREGGVILLSDETYFDYIKRLYLDANSKYIDVEYEYYLSDINRYEELFSHKLKKVIISKHIFDKTFSESEYMNIFTDMSQSSLDVLKFAIYINDKYELFTYMDVARKYSEVLKDKGKKCTFIAMGAVGRLSRIWPEYTNTNIVFLSAYNALDNNIGQMNYEYFVKFRKLLEKVLKN